MTERRTQCPIAAVMAAAGAGAVAGTAVAEGGEGCSRPVAKARAAATTRPAAAQTAAPGTATATLPQGILPGPAVAGAAAAAAGVVRSNPGIQMPGTAANGAKMWRTSLAR